MTRDLRKYAKQTNVRLGVGAALLLLVVGTILIYYIYGFGAAVAGFLCLISALVPLAFFFISPENFDLSPKTSNPFQHPTGPSRRVDSAQLPKTSTLSTRVLFGS